MYDNGPFRLCLGVLGLSRYRALRAKALQRMQQCMMYENVEDPVCVVQISLASVSFIRIL